MKEKIIKYLPAIMIASVMAIVIAVGILGFLNTGKGTPENSADTIVEDKNREGDSVNEGDIGGSIPIAPTIVGDITVEALNVTDRGIAVDSSFLIETKEAVLKKDLQQWLSFTGEGGLLIEEEGSNKYSLQLTEPMERNKVYQVVYSPPGSQPISFAFQTEQAFSVVSTLPGNSAYGVPVKTGIEITFNAVPGQGYEDYIFMEPQIYGRYETRGNTVIFIPERLENNVEYTITVKAGLPGADGEALSCDYDFQFYTEWSGYDDLRFSISHKKYETFLYEDDIFILMYMSSELSDQDISVAIYEVASAQSYTAYNFTSDMPEDARLINLIHTDVIANDSTFFVPVREQLEPGYYILEIKTENPKAPGTSLSDYQCIQVTGLSVYSLAVEGELCVWVMDSYSNEPAEGAKIIHGKNVAYTDYSGIGRLQNTETGNATITVEYGDYPPYIYRSPAYGEHEPDIADKYYTYLYTDRKYYMPEDAIDVFGVIRPIYEHDRLTGDEKITLKLGEMYIREVELDEYGTFAVKIPVTNMYNSANIVLEIDETKLAGRQINFMNYNRYQYIFDVAADKSVYYHGEDIHINMQVTTYDRAPVEGIEIKGPHGVVTTDSLGMASAVVQAEHSGAHVNGSPYNYYMNFTLGGVEEYMQFQSLQVKVLPGEVLIEAELVPGEGLEINVNAIDAGAIERYVNSRESFPYYVDPEVYKGGPADITVYVAVYKKDYIATQTDEYYDYINKVTVPVYQYETVESFVDSYGVDMEGGKAFLRDIPLSSSRYVSYYAKIIYSEDIKYYEFTVNLDDYTGYFSNYTNEKNFYLRLQRNSDDDSYPNRLSANETGVINIGNSYTDQTDFEGTLLLVAARNTIIEAFTGDSMGADFTFKTNYYPEVAVFGAYYDGKNIYPVPYPTYIKHDYTDLELQVEITNQVEEFEPGGKVTTEIRVTDKNGSPQKAMVNLSVVDAATMTGAYDYDPSFNADLYLSYWFYQKYHTFSSCSAYYYYAGLPSGAEQGGGGDDDYYIRDDFTDNPAFLSIETNDQGVALFEYTLSDSITSWVLTTHAITKDGYAGQARSTVITTLPYYVDMVMLNEFLAGDDICVVVKPYGSAFALGGAPADYTLEVSRGNDTVFTGSQSSSRQVVFNAGQLPAGDYTVLVKSGYGEHKDAMEEKIKVREEAAMLPIRQEASINSGNVLQIPDAYASPVKITAANGELKLILSTLYSTMVYNTERSDESAANSFGRDFLQKLYSPEDAPDKEWHDEKIKTDIRSYLLYQQGIPEISYGEGDPLYTARFAAAFPELITNSYLIEYVKENLGMYDLSEYGDIIGVSSRHEGWYDELLRAAGYFALAANGESVLLEIYDQIRIIENEENQDRYRKNYQDHLRVLFYGAALCALGDDTNARQLVDTYRPLNSLLNDLIKEPSYGEYVDTMMFYINTTVDSIAAYDYLLDKADNEYVSDVCEKINFIRKVVPRSGMKAAASYNLNGKQVTAELTNYDIINLEISLEQLEDLHFQSTEGNIAVILDYYGGVQNLDTAKNTIHITKTIHNIDPDNPNSWQIRFDIEFPEGSEEGYFTIIDRIPSNMRFSGNIRYENYYVSNEGGQRVQIGFGNYDKKQSLTLFYDVTKINNSNALPGTAYVGSVNRNNGAWGQSQ